VIKNRQDKLEMLVFGKEKKPILRVPIKSINEKQTTPVVISGERESESGTVVIKLYGKFEAKISVTELLLE
jgi:histidyl-tRNA synthetase